MQLDQAWAGEHLQSPVEEARRGPAGDTCAAVVEDTQDPEEHSQAADQGTVAGERDTPVGVRGTLVGVQGTLVGVRGALVGVRPATVVEALGKFREDSWGTVESLQWLELQAGGAALLGH